MNYRIDWRELYDHCSRKQIWLNVFQELIGNELGKALSDFTPQRYSTAKTYCPCSSHGSGNNESGKKKKSSNTSGKAYGLLPRAAETGASVCNSCGVQKNGFATIMFCTGLTFHQTLIAVAKTRTVGWIKTESSYTGPTKPYRKWVAPEIDVEKENKKVDKNQQILDKCFSLDHPKSELARLYFKNRGIKHEHNFSGDVLFHPALPYFCQLWDAENECHRDGYVKLDELPALVSKIRQPCGKFVNLHITYFSHDGTKAKDYLWEEWCKRSGIDSSAADPLFKKKNAPDVKKMRPRIEHLPVRGGGLHVCMPAEVMGVSEGLENIASIIDEISLDCWGLLNAGMMRNWVPTKITKAVVIFADHDEGGLKSAVCLRERLNNMGVFALIVTPHLINNELDESVDWNDFYNIYGEGSIAFVFDDVFIEELKAGTAYQHELPEWAFD